MKFSLLPLLNEKRDRTFIYVSFGLSAVFLPWAISFFIRDPQSWSFGSMAIYWFVMAACLAPYTLMLHATIHRPLFKTRYKLLNQYIPWVLGPLFGQSPGTYFAHHIGMHHTEGNGPKDTSTTLPYRRDHFGDFLKYWSKFMLRGAYDTAAYLRGENRTAMHRTLVTGEIITLVFMGTMFFVHPKATFAVLLIPMLICRFLLMAGNWGQHAFVDPRAPQDSYLNSTTCDKSFYNRISYNDGYHAIHHLMPRCHFLDMPVAFERKKAEHLARGAVVFEGLDFFLIWGLLMMKRYDILARQLVPLNADETIELRIARLKSRTQPIIGALAERAAAVAGAAANASDALVAATGINESLEAEPVGGMA